MIFKYIPINIFTILAVLLAIYAYGTYWNDNQDKSTPPKRATSHSSHNDTSKKVFSQSELGGLSLDLSEQILKSTTPKESQNIIERSVEKFSQTDTGKLLIDSLIRRSVNKEAGDKGITLHAAQQTGNILLADMMAGEGGPVMCGDKVTLHYQSYLAGDVLIDSTLTPEQPVTFTVGKGQVIPGLERGVIGMQKEGVRRVMVPSRYGYDGARFVHSVAKDSAVMMIVRVLDVAHGARYTSKPILLQALLEAKPGADALACGQKVRGVISLEDSSSSLQSNSSVKAGLMLNEIPIEWVIGSGQMPFAIDGAALALGVGETGRFVIASDHLKGFAGKVIASSQKDSPKVTWPKKNGATMRLKIIGIKDAH